MKQETGFPEASNFLLHRAATDCATIVRMELLAGSNLDLAPVWKMVADWNKDSQNLAEGIGNLAAAFNTFNAVVGEYSVPVWSSTRRGIVRIPREKQRANTWQKVSGFFADANSEQVMGFLSVLLIAKGVGQRLSLSGLQNRPGKYFREYEGVHAEQYKRLAGEVKSECGIDEHNARLEEVALTPIIEEFLLRSLGTKVAAA